MKQMEIERKFIIKYLPKEVESIRKITQKHVYKDSICSIRVRKSVDVFTNEKEFTHTIKVRNEQKQKYSICELEEKITEEEFEEAYPFRGSKVIDKYRCVVPIEGGLKVEVDVFDRWLMGLIIAEVEFESIEQAEKFQMPEWFRGEVSHSDYSNRKLSTQRRYEIMDMVGKQQMADNMMVVYDLQRRMADQNAIIL